MKVSILITFSTCFALVYSYDVLLEVIEDFPNNCSIGVERVPFIQIGLKYYFIEASKKLNWFAAAQNCRNMNAQLTSIESEDEMDDISQHLMQHHNNLFFWTSGNNLATKGKFEWFSTGKPMDYTKWAPYQPDNWQGNENCVHLRKNDGVYYINDLECYYLNYYICEANTPKTVSITIL